MLTVPPAFPSGLDCSTGPGGPASTEQRRASGQACGRCGPDGAQSPSGPNGPVGDPSVFPEQRSSLASLQLKPHTVPTVMSLKGTPGYVFCHHNPLKSSEQSPDS